MAGMGTQQPSQSPAHAEIVMVAERAVQQAIDDLRGELGVKFRGLEMAIQGS